MNRGFHLLWLISTTLKVCCKYNNRIPQSGPWLIGSRWHTVYIYCFITLVISLHVQIQSLEGKFGVSFAKGGKLTMTVCG